MTAILAVDQGTTNTKAVLVDETGRVLARASRPVEVSFPRPGWVEQDALALARSVRESIDECLGGAGERPAALAVTNQRESAVLWERRTGRPLGPVVSWQCRRTAAACADLRARGAAPWVATRTGLAIDPMFSATKMRWLLDHVEDGHRRADRGELCLGTVDSWLLATLTGGAVHATDTTNASRTQLLGLSALAWDQELLDLFGVPAAALPTVRPSSGPFGESIRLGRLPAGTPILAVAGDSHAALVGHGAVRAGVKTTYGTGSSLMTTTGGLLSSRRGLSSSVAWSRGERAAYALEGNIPVTGAAIDWLATLLGLADAPAVLSLATRVPDTGGVHVVPAFAGLGAPHWDEGARGTISGLHRGTTDAHLARAVLEGIAFQIADVFTAMEEDAGTRLATLLADGGASRSGLLMQLQADLLGRPVLRSAEQDLAAVGVAGLAALELGALSSIDDLAALPRARERFEPRLPEAERQARLAGWRQALARTRSEG